VTVEFPFAAFVLPVNVSVLVPEPGAAMLLLLKDAVTPVGNPDTLSATAALSPPAGTVVNAREPVPVWSMETADWAAESCSAGGLVS